jgi:hypothetical protein
MKYGIQGVFPAKCLMNQHEFRKGYILYVVLMSDAERSSCHSLNSKGANSYE